MHHIHALSFFAGATQISGLIALDVGMISHPTPTIMGEAPMAEGIGIKKSRNISLVE